MPISEASAATRLRAGAAARAVAIAVLALAVAIAGARALRGGCRARTRRRRADSARRSRATAVPGVGADRHHTTPGGRCPARFLGLSFEASALAQVASYGEQRRPRHAAALARARACCASAASRRTRRWRGRIARTPPPGVGATRDRPRRPAPAGATGGAQRLEGAADGRASPTTNRPRRRARSRRRSARSAAAWLGSRSATSPTPTPSTGCRPLPWTYAQLRRRGRALPPRDRAGRARRARSPVRACRARKSSPRWGRGRGAQPAARAADRPPLSARLPPGAGAVDRTAAQRAKPASSRAGRSTATCRCRGRARSRFRMDEVELGLLRRTRRDQQHVRLGAVGDRLHRAVDGGGRRRHQPPGQPRQLPRLLAGVRGHGGAPGGGRADRAAGVVRAAADATSWSATARCRRRSSRRAGRTSWCGRSLLAAAERCAS